MAITYEKDPRMARLPLMKTPVPTVIMCLAYLAFVKIIGPAFMRRRKPYDLRKLMIVYNFLLVAASIYMFNEFGKHGWYNRYSWKCANLDYSEDEESLAMVYTCWYFFLSKLVELADTVFFVLRKKYSQISTLHLIHHAIVPLTCWYAVTQAASGYNTLFGFLNSFVHIWMYLYYGLAALGPWIQKYLWWKKYLTALQMIQFCLVTVAMILFCTTPGCKVSAHLIALNLAQAVVFFGLFLNFYMKSYKRTPRAKLTENGACHQYSKPQQNGHDNEAQKVLESDNRIHAD